MHTPFKIPRKYERIIQQTMDIFIYTLDYENETNTLKFVLLYYYYIQQYKKNKDLFKNHCDIIEDLAKLFSQFTDVKSIYTHHQIPYPLLYINSISDKINNQ
jgi:hypothetical protein